MGWPPRGWERGGHLGYLLFQLSLPLSLCWVSSAYPCLSDLRARPPAGHDPGPVGGVSEPLSSVLPGLQQEPGSRVPAEVADAAPEPRETLSATPDLGGAQRAWQGPEGCTPFSQ